MRIRRWALLAAAVSIMLVAGSPVSAEEAEEEDPLERARGLVERRRWRPALDELLSLSFDESTPASVRIETLELVATVLVRMRRIRDARRTLQSLLDLDPGHELSSARPPMRLRVLFRNTKRRYEPQVDVQLSVRAPERFEAEGTATIEVRASGTTAGVDRVIAHVRPTGATRFRRRTMTRGNGVFTLDVENPGEERGIEFHVEALAPSGYVLAAAASEGAPNLIEGAPRAPPPPASRWYTSWWFWTLVGAAIAGATTAGVVLSIPEHHDGTLGSMEAP